MLQVGLTGNVASGKSTVARIWAEAGVPVVSADELARRAVEPGTPGLLAVVARFGTAILSADGTLDRERLRRQVFRDDGARADLERILHPRIAQLREAWLREREREGHPLVVSEIPLLFEAGLEDSVDRVVFVDASREVRLARLVEGRGLDEEEALRIMDAQQDPEEKARRADHVLRNDGSLEALAAAAQALLGWLREEARR